MRSTRTLTIAMTLLMLASSVGPAVANHSPSTPFPVVGAAQFTNGASAAGATVTVKNPAAHADHQTATTTVPDNGGWSVDGEPWSSGQTLHVWINGTGAANEYRTSGTIVLEKDAAQGYFDTGTWTLTLPPAPDLGIQSDDISIDRAIEGALSTVSIVVRNLGDADSTSALLTLREGTTTVATHSLGATPATGSQSVTLEWLPTRGGSTTLTASVGDSTPAERADALANNEATIPVDVTDYELGLEALDGVAKTTGPGASVTYSVRLLNQGNAPDTAQLTLSSVASGWTASVTPQSVEMAPAGTASATVTVTPPEGEVADKVEQPVTLTATSENQTSETASLTLTTTLDNLPVVRAIALGPASPVSSGEVEVAVEFSKPMDTTAPVTFTYAPVDAGGAPGTTVDGGFTDAMTWVGMFFVASGTDGEHTFSWTGGRDASELPLVESSGFPFRVDTIAPVTSDDVDGAWHTQPVTVTFHVEDASDTTTHYEVYSADAATPPNPTRTSPSGSSVVVSDDGVFGVRYFSVDVAGNVEEVRTAAHPIRIDATPPETTALVTGTLGENDWYVSSVSVELQATDLTSDVESTEYRVGDGEWTPYLAPVLVASEGETVLGFRSVDMAGNVEDEQQLTLRVDTRAPTSGATRTGTLGTNGWYVTPVEVELRAVDPEPGSGLNGTLYRIGGGEPVTYTGPFVVDTDGETVVSYGSDDAAGNLEDEQQLTLRVDTLRPTVAFGDDLPSTLTQSATATATVTVLADDANLLDTRVQATMPDGTVRTFATDIVDGARVATLGPFPQVGVVSLRVLARDAAGHSNESSPAELTVLDGVRPNVELTSPLTRRVDGTTTVTATASDNVGVALVRFLVDGTEAHVDEVAPYEFPWDTTLLANGEHVLGAVAVDNDGNLRTTTRTFFVANAPSVTGVVVTPTPDASVPQPVADAPIVIEVSVEGGSSGLGATLAWTTDGGATRTTVAGTPTDSGFTFEFPTGFPGGVVVQYAVRIEDSAGVSTRWPPQTFAEVPIYLPADPSQWTDAESGGSGSDIEHDWADLVDARVLVIGESVLFGMQMESGFNYAEPALYIVNFDVDADDAADYNLTATYTPGADPVVWTHTWNAEDEGATAVQPPVLNLRDDAAGILVLAVDAPDLLGLLEWPASLQVKFRTLGSEDNSSSVSLDATRPTLLLGSPGTLRDNEDATLTATVVDASGIATPVLYYSMNGADFVAAGAPAAGANGLYTWTLAAATLEEGTLSYFVSARDLAGNTNATSVQSVRVLDATPPSGTITAVATAAQGEAVEFSVADASADAIGYAWDFGDGATALGASVTHVFAAPGDRTVTLVLADESGNTATRTHTIGIADTVAPVVALVAPVTSTYVPADAGKVVVRAEDSGTIDAVQVSVDDGTTWTTATADASGTYSAPWDRSAFAGTTGVVVVRARASDAAGHSAETAGAVVTVDGVMPTAVAGTDVSGLAGASVSFTAAGSSDNFGIASYAWDFGDGTTATGVNPTHVFATAATYTVMLTVVDLAGNTATDSLIAAISQPAPPASSGGGSGNAAPAADTTPPTVTGVAPTGSVATATPTITATYSDGQGVDVTSVRLELDGVQVTLAQVSATQLSYVPTTPLAEGEHTARVRLADAAGNTAEREWTFVVALPVDAPPLPPTDDAVDDVDQPEAETGGDEVPEVPTGTEDGTSDLPPADDGEAGDASEVEDGTQEPEQSPPADPPGTVPGAEADGGNKRWSIPGPGLAHILAALAVALLVGATRGGTRKREP